MIAFCFIRQTITKHLASPTLYILHVHYRVFYVIIARHAADVYQILGSSLTLMTRAKDVTQVECRIPSKPGAYYNVLSSDACHLSWMFQCVALEEGLCMVFER